MMHQVFLMTRAFTQPPQRRRRVALQRPVARSRSKVEGRSAHTGGRRQQSDQYLSSGSDMRASKIAQLRHAVESGHYCVSAEQVAEKMAHEALVGMLTQERWRGQA